MEQAQVKFHIVMEIHVHLQLIAFQGFAIQEQPTALLIKLVIMELVLELLPSVMVLHVLLPMIALRDTATLTTEQEQINVLILLVPILPILEQPHFVMAILAPLTLTVILAIVI
jgi:hypothetical protein